MNNSMHMRFAALAVAVALVWAAPARAGNPCEMVDADLGTEFAGESTALGDSALSCGIFNAAPGDISVAIGNSNLAEGQASIAFGSVNEAGGDQSIAIGSQNFAGPASVAIGTGNQATGDSSIAIGDGNTASGAGSIVLGAASAVTADRGVAIGTGSFVSAENSVALGAGASADRANTVSVGAAGNERQITNVAAGTQATDAVNLAQLRANGAQSIAVANAYTDSRIGGLNARIDGLDGRLDRVGALNAAMVGMAASAAAVEGGATRIGVAAGTYGGKNALSIGVQRRFGSRMAMTLGGAFSGSERSGTVGVGFGF